METGRRARLPLLLALAVLVPLLVGYDLHYQLSTPILDLRFDESGRVLDVPENSFADWAGFHVGDRIVSVDGQPFEAWRMLHLGTYRVEIERAGRTMTLELPAVPMARVNLSSLLTGMGVTLLFWGTGLMLILRKGDHPHVRLAFLLMQSAAVALLPMLAHPCTLPSPPWIRTLSITTFHLIAPLFLAYALTFPRPTLPPRWRRIGGWGLAAATGTAVALALRHSPTGWMLSGLYATALVLGGVGAMLHFHRYRATPDERRQLRLILVGTLLAILPAVLLFFLPTLFHLTPAVPRQAVGLFLILIPLSYGYATARHHLFGIDRLLNRTLVYALLSLGIFALYLGPFLLLTRFLPGEVWAQAMVVATLTLLVGLSFNWARTQVQRHVDRLFYGGWYDYPGVVSRVSEALSHSLSRAELAEVLSTQVPALMQLRGGRLSFEEPAPDAERGMLLPLTFQGEVCGWWEVGRRKDGDALNADDRRILETLGRQAEVALGKVLLVERLRRQLEELREAQHRLLRSREEERARLARELHDGPIQALVEMNLHLGLLLADQTEAAAQLQPLRTRVRALINELRGVCAVLRPPMLDTLGLGAALRALADEWSAQQRTPVLLTLPPMEALLDLTEERAVNLYRIAQEALANVARHAEASQVVMQLRRQEGWLELTIRDDGRGFTPPSTAHPLVEAGHFGLAGMEERARLIDGTLQVRSAPGEGTTVRVLCPLPAA